VIRLTTRSNATGLLKEHIAAVTEKRQCLLLCRVMLINMQIV
jgi:hypothetical protein